MENNDNLVIVIDPGHGGWDNGASYQGRLEKDDNLRLGLEVRNQLQRLGVTALMTRDTDVFIPLQDRAEFANRNDADLFISLHRNSYTHQTPSTNGVENFIYLTAPEATSGKAAQLVLDEVVNVGVQSNRGVNRGNYYVLRRTRMPAMLLEMGFIINEEDNRLFDEKLVPYAQAIAKGALAFFGVPSNGVAPPVSPPVTPPGTTPPSNGGPGNANVAAAQRALNTTFGSGLLVDGIFGPKTKTAAIRALQTTINNKYGIGLTVDGILGPKTKAAIPTFSLGDRGEGVVLIQAMLMIKGYNPGTIDGVFGPLTKSAVQMFQRDNFLTADGVAGPKTIIALLS